jgi:hypothetical protein
VQRGSSNSCVQLVATRDRRPQSCRTRERSFQRAAFHSRADSLRALSKYPLECVPPPPPFFFFISIRAPWRCVFLHARAVHSVETLHRAAHSVLQHLRGDSPILLATYCGSILLNLECGQTPSQGLVNPALQNANSTTNKISTCLHACTYLHASARACNVVLQVGADGVILWGSSGDYRNCSDCGVVAKELDGTAGPLISTCAANRAACAAQVNTPFSHVCSGVLVSTLASAIQHGHARARSLARSHSHTRTRTRTHKRTRTNTHIHTHTPHTSKQHAPCSAHSHALASLACWYHDSQHCSGHGRCVDYTRVDELLTTCATETSFGSPLTCRCDPGYTGSSCESAMTSSS